MAEYRDRTTGALKTQGQLRKENRNMSMPKVWNSDVLDALNVDLVTSGPQPTEGIGVYQTVRLGDPVQDSNGNWVREWSIVDLYDGPDKADKEAAYQVQLDTAAAERNRETRDELIAATDWWAVADRTMTAEQTAYRQALRDITTHANWPHLEDADWPTKP